jgi:hypothetical protein
MIFTSYTPSLSTIYALETNYPVISIESTAKSIYALFRDATGLALGMRRFDSARVRAELRAALRMLNSVTFGQL